MKITYKWRITRAIVLASVYFFAYYILTARNLHTSIHAIINYSHELDVKGHLIVLGILPIYIAMIIFGAGMIAFGLKSLLDHATPFCSLFKKVGHFVGKKLLLL